MKVSLSASILEDGGLVKLGRLSGEDIYFSSWWSRLAKNYLFLGVWTWWEIWPHTKRGQLGQTNQVLGICSGLFPELVSFDKCIGLHILGLGRTMKTYIYPLHFLKQDFLHLG